MTQFPDALVVLENGKVFPGRSLSLSGRIHKEILISSEYADYQGVLCSPEAAGRVVLMTYPHIGNTGWDGGIEGLKASAVLMAHYEDVRNGENGAKGLTLAEALKKAQIPAVYGLDTRALAKMIYEGNISRLTVDTNANTNGNAGLSETKAPPEAATAKSPMWLEAPPKQTTVKPSQGKRTDLKKILIIGSGPIIIGQACEFDYSGVQAAKTLKAEGYEVILVNSNPATIMTDPQGADQTYVEPLTPEYVEAVIAKERPQALLATMGGQTALNMAMKLYENGALERYGVTLIGADCETIQRAEDRESFRKAVTEAGLKVPQSGVVGSLNEAINLAAQIGFPVIIRPSFTMGGAGGGVAWNHDDLIGIVENGLDLSLNHEVLLEKSVIGWKELELEVLCDQAGQMVAVCTIENIDAMGVHTGDSITVAPAQTLTGAEVERLIEESRLAVVALGIRNSGCNLQFALHPGTGEMLIIEVNPRVSRSSALASKATGVPIAKISTLLAVGYTLDEILLEMTGEPLGTAPIAIDYVAVKIPRWNFEKFPDTTDELTTSMRSVGEVMSLGRSFLESLQKGFRSLETPWLSLLADPKNPALADGPPDKATLEAKLSIPNSERFFYLVEAFRQGWTERGICKLTHMTPWFIRQIGKLVEVGKELENYDWSRLGGGDCSPDPGGCSSGSSEEVAAELLRFKTYGFSDAQLAWYAKGSEDDIRRARQRLGVTPVYKAVDACAGRVSAKSPYYYSTYQSSVQEAKPGQKETVIVIGNGPNRIGQGLEFDYCCVHAAYALREIGYDAVMINSNPETVSTDYDTSCRLYFEPLTFEDVMGVIEVEKPKGVIIQFGGQTPLNLAKRLEEAGVTILGTAFDSIDQAEDRERFTALIEELGLSQPEHGNAHNLEEALNIAFDLGYPVLVRPSYVLGGRNMRIIYCPEDLEAYIRKFQSFSEKHPLLIDKFLIEATELDVDALSDGQETIVGGIIEQIERGGIHSGDSAGIMPPRSLDSHQLEEIKQATRVLGQSLKVVGLMNIQFAVQKQKLYVLEVNPRASRTAPFVSKATGQPLAGLATKIIMGRKISELDIKEVDKLPYMAVKESVFSFERFPGVDPLLGPEMRSTGEVMGLDKSSYGLAMGKALEASCVGLPLGGGVFISIRDEDKEACADIARSLYESGFELLATSSTADLFRGKGLPVKNVPKISDNSEDNALVYIKDRKLHLVINITSKNDRLGLASDNGSGSHSGSDEQLLRRTALLYQVPIITTMAGAVATAEAIRDLKKRDLIKVSSLQEYYAGVGNNSAMIQDKDN